MGAVVLQEEELLGLEGKLVHVAFLSGCDLEVEPYIIFGPQRKIYGLEAVPELKDYSHRWVAFDLEPTKEQVEKVRHVGSNDRSTGSPPREAL